MNAAVLIRGPDGVAHELVHGDVIGRLWSAALQVHDGRVSEAHAMISLREGQLRLLALRGSFALDGRPLPEVVLEAGQRIQLARDVEIAVERVDLPGSVLGVEGTNLRRQVLPGVCSVMCDPGAHPDRAIRVVHGWRDDARWRLWSDGATWFARGPDGARQVAAGDELSVGAATLQLVDVPLRQAGPDPTRRAGDFDAPLTLVACYDSVDVQRDDAIAVRFTGKQANLISELIAVDGPLSWGALTEELWPDEREPMIRRSRLDVLLTRIRRRLRAAGVRDDIVRTDRSGQVSIFLHPRDRVVDRL